jgi:hypothetical protein
MRSGKPIIYKGIQKLISEGYLVINKEKSDANYNYGKYFIPTDKGKNYINGELFFWFMGEEYRIEIALANKAFKGIKEILIDEQNNVAYVSYWIANEKIEPLFSLVCGNESFCVDKYNIGNKHEEKIRLKKFDKGWRIID